MPIKTNLDSGKYVPVRQEYVLPSHGILYIPPDDGTGNKAAPFSSVIIKPYSYETEKILTTNLSFMEKVSRIVSLIVDNLPEWMDVKNLLIDDVFVILSIARALTYGENFTFSTKCTECGFEETHKIKIPEQLPVNVWSGELDPKSEFVVMLPNAKDRVEYRYLTIAQEQEAMSSARMSKAASRVDEDFYALYRTAMHLASVNNTTPDNIGEAVQYVRRLEGADMVAFEDAVQSHRCGLRPEWKVACENCGHTFSQANAIETRFFRRD